MDATTRLIHGQLCPDHCVDIRKSLQKAVEPRMVRLPLTRNRCCRGNSVLQSAKKSQTGNAMHRQTSQMTQPTSKPSMKKCQDRRYPQTLMQSKVTDMLFNDFPVAQTQSIAQERTSSPLQQTNIRSIQGPALTAKKQNTGNTTEVVPWPDHLFHHVSSPYTLQESP